MREEGDQLRVGVLSLREARNNAFLSFDHLRNEGSECSLVLRSSERQDYIDTSDIMMAWDAGLVSEAKHLELLFNIAIQSHSHVFWSNWLFRTTIIFFLL